MILKTLFRKSFLHKLVDNHIYTEAYIWRDERKRFLSEAREKFAQGGCPGGSLADYAKALDRHRVTFSEYMYSYEYWRLDEAARDAFVSRSEMQCIYRKMVTAEVRATLNDKVAFLKKFAKFARRRWLVARDASAEELKALVTATDCIAKPIVGTCGQGIFKICANEVDDWQQLYARCRDGNMLVEECVRACPEIEAIHPQSLNTIRVVTMSNEHEVVPFGALLRMGCGGSVIDNTHAGGVFAPINIKTGVIEIDGIDGKNHHYPTHPDTGKPIKGFKIPHWDKVLDACSKACHVLPGMIFAGWDLCVTPDGSIEIIEGNHAPDFDGGMQAPLKTGVKAKMRDTVKHLTGTDPTKLISIWSKW